MKRFILGAAAAAIAIAISATPAAALQIRTFVSGHGADTGTCGVGSPCRTFAYAITQTAASGEIAVLNSAGYGSVTITKALSIVNANGLHAALTPNSGQDAITISAGAGDVVNLQGLTLTGVGTGRNGITFDTGGILNIKDCVVRDFTETGIFLAPSTQASVTVSDTIVSNNNLAINLVPSLSATLALIRVQSIGNSYGFSVDGSNAPSSSTVRATAISTVASSGGNSGFIVNAAGGSAQPIFKLENSVAFNMGIGINAASSKIIITGTTLFENVTGYAGAIETFGNNYIYDTNNNGTLTPTSPQ